MRSMSSLSRRLGRDVRERAVPPKNTSSSLPSMADKEPRTCEIRWSRSTCCVETPNCSMIAERSAGSSPIAFGSDIPLSDRVWPLNRPSSWPPRPWRSVMKRLDNFPCLDGVLLLRETFDFFQIHQRNEIFESIAGLLRNPSQIGPLCEIDHRLFRCGH